jgi:predicted MFS family arabinose efflux permease
MVKRPPLSSPWLIVLGSTLTLIVCNGPVLAFTFGVFLKPVSQEFHWSRGAVSAAGAMASLMFAIGAPLTGMLVDRWGARRVLLPIIPLAALSIAAISLTHASLWTFIALYTVAGLAFAGHGPQPHVRAIAGWIDKKRGLALGTAMTGVGVGIILVPQLTRYLIEVIGWRHAYVVLGAGMLAVAFPAVSLLVRDPPQDPARHAPRGQDPASPYINFRRSVLGSGHFWLLAAPVFLVAMAVNGTNAHLVPLLTDRGSSLASATSTLGAVGLAGIVGRLSCGYLADRFPAPQVAAAFFLLPCIGILLLIAHSAGSAAALGAISLGLALGCEIDMMGLLATRYFGLQHLGEIYGYLFAVFSAGSALGTYLMGIAFDSFHSYNELLLSFIVVLLVASALISRLGRHHFAAGDSAPRNCVTAAAGSRHP